MKSKYYLCIKNVLDRALSKIPQLQDLVATTIDTTNMLEDKLQSSKHKIVHACEESYAKFDSV